MAFALDHPPEDHAGVETSWLQVAAFASLGAGVVHAAAIAGHAEHHQAVWAFLAVAVAQLAWGAAAVARPHRALAVVGAALGLAAVAAWVLAKNRGVWFVDGLDDKEPVQFADGLAAALAAVTLVASGVAVLGRRLVVPNALVGAAFALVVAVTIPATTGAVDHVHAHEHDAVLAAATPAGTEVAEPPAAVPPRPFDPRLPIDLGGVDGVTPEQQARAENLLAATVQLLPQWSDPEYDEAHGFRSIGDGVTGTEHFLNRAYMDDDVILDPSRPESLVFDVDAAGNRTLAAAMYMLTPGATLDDVPDVGGALTQWHIHNNLCFTESGQVAGLTDGEGNCPAGLQKGDERPMMHVWIRPHPCGPFAALDGIGGGQIAEGETVACDHVHGH